MKTQLLSLVLLLCIAHSFATVNYGCTNYPTTWTLCSQAATNNYRFLKSLSGKMRRYIDSITKLTFFPKGTWKKCYSDGASPASYTTDVLTACPVNTTSGYVSQEWYQCTGGATSCGAVAPVLECMFFFFFFINF